MAVVSGEAVTTSLLEQARVSGYEQGVSEARRATAQVLQVACDEADHAGYQRGFADGRRFRVSWAVVIMFTIAGFACGTLA